MAKLSKMPSENALHERYYNVTQGFPSGTMFDYLRECNEGHEAEVAFDYLGATITYGKLFRMVERVAKSLMARGVGPGDAVAVVMPSQPETYYILYACSAIGAAACMIDLRYPKDYLAGVIRKAGADVAFVSTATGTALAGLGERAVAVETGESVGIADLVANRRIREAAKAAPANELAGVCTSWKGFLKEGADAPARLPAYVPGRTAVMVGTGGTTGTPKLVELSNEAINAAVFQVRNAGFRFRRGDVWYDIMPPFIAYGAVDGLHLPLTLGMRTVLEPAPSVDALIGALRAGANHMTASPAFYIDLARRKDVDDLDLSELLSPIVGGRSVNLPQERRINEFLAERGCESRLYVGWGLTETCGAISVAAVDALVKEQSCGKTLTGGITAAFKEVGDGDGARFTELPYADAWEGEVPDGAVGELWYTGPNMMTGYFDDPEETAGVLVEQGGRTWLRTGDVGYVDSEGSIFITNRIKDFIARKDGFKTPPKEIEDVIVSAGGIDEVAVVGAASPRDEEDTLVVAFYTKLDASVPDGEVERAAKDAVAGRLAEYKWPDLYVCLESIPYTPIGKVDRVALRERAAQALSERPPSAEGAHSRGLAG